MMEGKHSDNITFKAVAFIKDTFKHKPPTRSEQQNGNTTLCKATIETQINYNINGSIKWQINTESHISCSPEGCYFGSWSGTLFNSLDWRIFKLSFEEPVFLVPLQKLGLRCLMSSCVTGIFIHKCLFLYPNLRTAVDYVLKLALLLSVKNSCLLHQVLSQSWMSLRR